MARKRYVSKGQRIVPGVYAPTNSSLTQEKILAKVRYVKGCWEWPHLHKGYPSHGAHRRAYELWIGPIPKGAEIDHKCRNITCVNPQHLRAVNRSFNSHLRQMARTGQMSKSDLRVAIWLHDLLGEKLLERYGAEGSMV